MSSEKKCHWATIRSRYVTESFEILEGETNYITVDRENILETTFEELKHVTDPRVTFEVQFIASKLLTLVDLARSGLDYAIRISRTLTLIIALKSTCENLHC